MLLHDLRRLKFVSLKAKYNSAAILLKQAILVVQALKLSFKLVFSICYPIAPGRVGLE